MKAGIEWFAGIVRAGPEYKEHGDPFTFVATIVREGDSAVIKGARGDFTKEVYRAIFSELKSAGIKSVEWDKKNNKTRNIKKLVE